MGHEDFKGRLLAVKTIQVALHEKLEINFSPVRTVAVVELVHRNFFHTAWRHNGRYFALNTQANGTILVVPCCENACMKSRYVAVIWGLTL